MLFLFYLKKVKLNKKSLITKWFLQCSFLLIQEYKININESKIINKQCHYTFSLNSLMLIVKNHNKNYGKISVSYNFK